MSVVVAKLTLTELVTMVKPHVARLLEQSNDVEKNPGPPKVS